MASSTAVDLKGCKTCISSHESQHLTLANQRS